ncbi:MAG: hypothetical protein ACP5N5_01330, partial [Desulfurococcus sp.]
MLGYSDAISSTVTLKNMPRGGSITSAPAYFLPSIVAFVPALPAYLLISSLLGIRYPSLLCYQKNWF